MKQYLELIQRVIDTGEWTENRTGIKTLMVPGAMMTYDLREGFPAVTTKKLAFKSVVGELCAFLRASRSAADFRALGCKVWDENANGKGQLDKDGNVVAPNAWLTNPYRTGEDDLGPVYGVQWREWPGFKYIEVSNPNRRSVAEVVREVSEFKVAMNAGWTLINFGGRESTDGTITASAVLYKEIDQLRTCLDTIVNNPDSRRILFHGWNPAVLDQVALPACHVLYQFMPNRKAGTIHMNVYVRSNDLLLGAPFNIASAAALLSLVGRLTGYTPGLLNVMIGDAHIYETHMDAVQEQLSRSPQAFPILKFNERVPEFHRDGYKPEWLELIEPSDFALENYKHAPAINAPMAI